jgi:hypothetical protein
VDVFEGDFIKQHTARWWRDLFDRSGLLQVEYCEELEDADILYEELIRYEYEHDVDPFDVEISLEQIEWGRTNRPRKSLFVLTALKRQSVRTRFPLDAASICEIIETSIWLMTAARKLARGFFFSEERMPVSERTHVLIPLPDRDFDPTECAIPWQACASRGWQVAFSTEHGNVAQAEPNQLRGPILGPLGAGSKALAAYRK